MASWRAPDVPREEITDKRLYFNRRAFMRVAGGGVAAAAAAALGTRSVLAAGRPAVHGPKLERVRKSDLSTTEAATPWDDITSYNNFYEFAGSDTKDLPSLLAPDQELFLKSHRGNCRAF